MPDPNEIPNGPEPRPTGRRLGRRNRARVAAISAASLFALLAFETARHDYPDPLRPAGGGQVQADRKTPASAPPSTRSQHPQFGRLDGNSSFDS